MATNNPTKVICNTGGIDMDLLANRELTAEQAALAVKGFDIMVSASSTIAEKQEFAALAASDIKLQKAVVQIFGAHKRGEIVRIIRA